jgi:hypothetical protein
MAMLSRSFLMYLTYTLPYRLFSAQTSKSLGIFPNVANHFFIDLSGKRDMSIMSYFRKNHAQKLAVRAKCKGTNCTFNGVVLVSKKKTKQEGLKDEACPFCHNLGLLELVWH